MGARRDLERNGHVMKPHWIITGPKRSWGTAFEQGGIWGVKHSLYPEWKALEQGDIIFFYATAPIKGIIGVGRVETKFIQDKPLWPDEIAIGKVLYPFRFEFHTDYVLEQNMWHSKRISQSEVPLSIQEMRRGINFLRDMTIERLHKMFEQKFNHVISITEETRAPHAEVFVTEKLSPDHTKVKDMLFEIGKLNRFISEKEYAMGNERLDVVWRRLEKSVPTYVFEIQFGGDIYHALGKLKHASDLWNSNIFLIASEADFEKAELLLSGTFHEIQSKIKKTTYQKIHELYQQKRRWVDLEKEIGLL
jgi:hypothetical protein